MFIKENLEILKRISFHPNAIAVNLLVLSVPLDISVCRFLVCLHSCYSTVYTILCLFCT